MIYKYVYKYMEAVSLHIYWSIHLDYPYNPIQLLIFIAELRMLFLTYTSFLPLPYFWTVQHHPSIALQWHHNEHEGVPNYQPYDCLLERLFRRRSQKTSKLRVTGLCVENSPVTGEFPAQRASNA